MESKWRRILAIVCDCACRKNRVTFLSFHSMQSLMSRLQFDYESWSCRQICLSQMSLHNWRQTAQVQKRTLSCLSFQLHSLRVCAELFCICDSQTASEIWTIIWELWSSSKHSEELDSTAREIDGNLYCLKCHDHMGVPVCGACRRPIEDRVITALGKHWHVEHFVCAFCERPFLGTKHYEKKGAAYCESHYYLLFGNIDFITGEIIENGKRCFVETVLVFFEMSEIWSLRVFMLCSLCRGAKQNVQTGKFPLLALRSAAVRTRSIFRCWRRAGVSQIVRAITWRISASYNERCRAGAQIEIGHKRYMG